MILEENIEEKEEIARIISYRCEKKLSATERNGIEIVQDCANHSFTNV